MSKAVKLLARNSWRCWTTQARLMKKIAEYPFELRPLSDEEGGGWLINYPDLPGCISDGETPEEAMANGKDALAAWLKAVEEVGHEVP